MDKLCPNDGNILTLRPAGVSKAGRNYPAFYACPDRNCGHTENVVPQNRPFPQRSTSAREPLDQWSGGQTGSPYKGTPDKDLIIAREAAVHAVTRLFAGTEHAANLPMGDVVRMADELVEFYYNGLPKTEGDGVD